MAHVKQKSEPVLTISAARRVVGWPVGSGAVHSVERIEDPEGSEAAQKVVRKLGEFEK